MGTAVLAHIPCCGSTILLALGGATSGATWLVALERFRPLLIAVSAVQIGLGLFFAYRKPHKCHKCGTCESENHARRRVEIGLLWGAALFVTVLTLVGQVFEQHP